MIIMKPKLLNNQSRTNMIIYSKLANSLMMQMQGIVTALPFHGQCL